jgi:hypothetical protein
MPPSGTARYQARAQAVAIYMIAVWTNSIRAAEYVWQPLAPSEWLQTLPACRYCKSPAGSAANPGTRAVVSALWPSQQLPPCGSLR